MRHEAMATACSSMVSVQSRCLSTGGRCERRCDGYAARCRSWGATRIHTQSHDNTHAVQAAAAHQRASANTAHAAQLVRLCRRVANGLFDVPDDVWRHYVGEEQRHQILCITCGHWLVELIDGGEYQAQHGGPVPLWSDAWRVRHGISADAPCPPLPPWFTVSEIECQG